MKVEIDVIEPARPSLADQRLRKLVYFAVANLVSVAIAVGIFWGLGFGIADGGRFDRALGLVHRFLSSHMGVTALAASTPFFASLLVGQFEMRKARARRARQEAEARRERIAAELDAEQAARAARRAI